MLIDNSKNIGCFAPEQVAMPSLEQLNDFVAQSETLKLSDTHPFEAYAMANFYLYDNSVKGSSFVSETSLLLEKQISTSHKKIVLGDKLKVKD